ncbi:thermonuclease family protein [Rufibacter quisquiliarum]|uniref:Endonuclease YncB(Thermonuclease family) n=1 Tax=Rufibacter quisquiliarum TaxID=1549639 RepID=A0A839GCX2_9BACT|nr:thermonuclease family protein [Rufibacter quisquiliarum]MBA9076230.1 endonuclease YncB(thermonuclease family) [Rufibacter quisquiliarum]
MRSGQLLLLKCWVWLFLFVSCQQAQKQEQQPEPQTGNGYKVIAIKDGDTIELLKDGKPLRVRLYGVDAPEKNQDFGTKSRMYTSEMAFGKYVQLVEHNLDRYGRTVGEIILPDGRNLNEELVRNGFAWHYVAYSKSKQLAQLEAEARADKRGLWAGPSPQAPWEFRNGKRKKAAAGKKQEQSDIKDTAQPGSAGRVFICDSKSASTYHVLKGCRALASCKSEVRTITSAQAAVKNRHPCKVCAQ